MAMAETNETFEGFIWHAGKIKDGLKFAHRGKCSRVL